MTKQLALVLVVLLALAGAAFAAPSVQPDQELAYAPATGPPVMVLATITEMDPAVGQTGTTSSIDIELADEIALVQPPKHRAVARGGASDYYNDTVAVGADRNDRPSVTTGVEYFPEVGEAKSFANDLRGTKRLEASDQLVS